MRTMGSAGGFATGISHQQTALSCVVCPLASPQACGRERAPNKASQMTDRLNVSKAHREVAAERKATRVASEIQRLARARCRISYDSLLLVMIQLDDAFTTDRDSLGQLA